MKKELQEKIFKDFPLLYGDRTKPMRQSLMCFGLEVNDGWYDIIYKLSSQLEEMIKDYLAKDPDGSCECGCKKVFHLNEKACMNLFYIPYQVGKRYWGISLLHEGSFKNRFKNFFKLRWGKLKLFVQKYVNKFLWQACEYFSIYKTIPCKCKQYYQHHPKAMQVKEKFGELRFYMATSTEEMEKLIEEAEELSSKTCEVCSAEGKLRTERYWLLTLCDKCNEEENIRLSK